MFNLSTPQRRTAKVGVLLACVTALGGGAYSAQAADDGAQDGRAVVEASTPQDGTGANVAAADTAGKDYELAPAPTMEEAADPDGDTNGGRVVAAPEPRVDERPAPAPRD